MNSIAKNHLSQYGRFGDTEIAETSSGDLWHVNQYEKKLIDNYGNIGERIVDIVGSGTSNPTTGLKEQFAWMPFIMGAQALLTIGQGAQQSALQREKAASQEKLSGLKIGQLETAEKKLSEDKNAKMTLLDLETQDQFQDISATLSQKSLDIEEGAKTAMQQTGLRTSAGVSKQELKSDISIKNIYEQTSDQMTTQYGKAIGQIEGDFEAEKSRLRNEKNQAIIERDLYRKESEKKGMLETLMGW